MYDGAALPRLIIYIVAVVAIGACYDPSIRPCTVTCSTAADCSNGQSCSAGVCQRPGDSCPVGGDADVDAPDIDAMTGDADNTDAPDGSSGATWSKLAVGGYHACAITTDGALWCWGNNDYRQLGSATPTRTGAPLRVDGISTDWEQVAAGARHTCGIRTDGSLWCWGLNDGRQCGTTSGSFAVPTRVADPSPASGTRWTAVTLGYSFTCALRDSGTLWCFGTADAGQLGNGQTAQTTAMPVRAGTGTDWRSIDAGYTHICGVYGAQAQRGQIACWGNNAMQYRIGDGMQMNRSVPTEIADNGTSDWQRVSVSDYAACALEANGEVWCWGDRFHIPEGVTSNTPTRWGTSTGYERVALGEFGGCVVDGGVISCYGYNLEGELGFQPSQGTGSPNPVAGVTAVQEAGAGAAFVCVLHGAGSISCWGDRGDGQLGDGVVGDPRTPTEVLGAHHPWRTVELGDEHACGVTMAGAAFCWGSNYGGQIGGGFAMTAPLYEAPIAVAPTGSWQRIVGGHAHGCALSDTNLVSCWGNNDYGQRGVIAGSVYDPTQVDAVALSELAIGLHSNCGVAGGARRCWGLNDVSQLGNGGNGAVTVPTTITEALNSWTKVSMGDQFGCGLAAGALHCWGYNNAGQVGQPVTTSIYPSPAAFADPTPGTTDTWFDISAGAGHACGVLSTDNTSGTAWCWGYNGRGQLGSVRGDGPMATSVPNAPNFIDISSGYGHTCGVRLTGELHCWGSNDSGELGDGSLNPHTTIGATIGGMTDWVAVDAGQYLTCGIRGVDRRLYCWGDNRYGQAGTGGAVRWMPAAVPTP